MDSFKYFILLNFSEKDCFFKLDPVRGYCDGKCTFCKKCSSSDIVRIVEPENIDFYDKNIIQHQARVAELSGRLVYKLGLKDDKVSIEQAALLHDIGKLAVPEKILSNKRRLKLKEYGTIKKHAVLGEDYLKNKGFPEFITEVVRHHHERFDGSGYPDGLKGTEIPIGARCITVVDSFNAMTTDRPYKKAISHDKAVRELKRNAGTQFDPDIVNVFLTVIEREEAKVV